MISGDKASAMVLVPVPPEIAFQIFTEETDIWWRRGIAYRVAGRSPGTIMFADGRLFEQYESGVHETGTVLAWEPPSRLVFEWRGANFEPGEVTQVQVTFVPTASGTRVTVEHSGFAALRPGHPVRHGKPPAEFVAGIGRWWGDLLTGLRVHALGRETDRT
ncbi:MAG TPA: SRPBCC domain-containing protein [Kofleriaceae bacterium]